jgi:hypothetical protein
MKPDSIAIGAGVAAALAWLVALGAGLTLLFAELGSGMAAAGAGALLLMVLMVSAGIATLGALVHAVRTKRSVVPLGMVGSAAIGLALGGLSQLVGALAREQTPALPALHAACARGDEAQVTALIESGADVEERDAVRYLLPISYAATSGDVATLEVLTAHGAGLHDPELIESATFNRDAAVLEWLLDHEAPSIDGVRLSPLAMAVCLPSERKVRALIEHGARTTALTGHSGMSALEVAASCGQWTLFPLLGGDESLRTRALFRAIDTRQSGSVEALLAAGADPSARDVNDTAPLGLAIERGDVELVRRLVRHGASLDAPVRGRERPLEVARYDEAMVAELRALGAR